MCFSIIKLLFVDAGKMVDASYSYTVSIFRTSIEGLSLHRYYKSCHGFQLSVVVSVHILQATYNPVHIAPPPTTPHDTKYETVKRKYEGM